VGEGGKETNLLMLRLFFLEPKRPWIITIGSPFAVPLLSWRLYARSTTLKLADAWNDRVHVGLGVSCDSCIIVLCFGCKSGAHIGCMLRDIDRIVSVDVARSRGAGTFFGAKRRRHFRLL
jgi:hypothetical protein